MSKRRSRIALAATGGVVLTLTGAIPAVAGDAASDTFTRTVATGWGSAPTGGAYSLTPTDGMRVDGTAGVMPVTPGQTRRASLPGVSSQDSDVQMTLVLRTLPASGRGIYLGPAVNVGSGFASYYQAQLKIAPSGATMLRLVHKAGTVGNQLTADVTLPFTVRNGQAVVVRAQTAGTTTKTLRARAWPVGATEPTAWQVSAQSSAISQAGTVGLVARVPSTGMAAVVAVDALSSAGLPAPPEPSDKPAASNTGVPDGTALTHIHPEGGVLRITTPGAVYDRVHIHGYVSVRAPNVRITRSRISGPTSPPALTTSAALLSNTNGNAPGLVVEDTTIVPDHPHVYLTGVFGYDFTLRRVEIARGVDGVMIFGSNARIEQSWIHDLAEYATDPRQGNGPTHNDGVQVQGGGNIRIIGNTITDGRNAALMVTQDHSATSDMWFNNNWADHGSCHVNISKKSRPFMTGLQVNNNRFGHHATNRDCAILYEPTHSDLKPSGNVWEDTGGPAGIKRPT